MAKLLAFSLIVVSLIAANALTVGAARLKIKLANVSEDPGFFEKYQALRRKRQSANACDDKVSIDRSNLTLPGQLNRLHDRVRFYRSEYAREGLAALNERTVPGLGGQTVGNVFQVLRDGQCLPLLFGGSVRDQFLGVLPGDVDVEVDCMFNVARDICQRTWGEENCAFNENPQSPIGHIGNGEDLDDNIDYASTDATFYAQDPLTVIEYTVNALAYDTNGNDVIIDLSGTGVEDVCNRLIKIPSDDDSEASWDEWRTSSGEGDTGRLYRFWKLRQKGFQPYNDATLEYIVRYSKTGIDSNPDKFRSFYCKVAYAGSRHDSNENVCVIAQGGCVPPTLLKAYQYNTVLAQDFSSYWHDIILPYILPFNECVCPQNCAEVFCSSQGIRLAACATEGQSGSKSVQVIQWQFSMILVFSYSIVKVISLNYS